MKRSVVAVIFFRFAGEAGDYVGANRGMGQKFLDEFDRGGRSVRRGTSGASPRECGWRRIAAACGSAGRSDRLRQRDRPDRG